MYSIDTDSFVTGAGIAGIFAILGAMVFLIAIIGIVLYVFASFSLYTAAKNRGVQNPWLAWIPVGNFWIAGKLLDYYFAREGKTVFGGKVGFALIAVCAAGGGVVLSSFPNSFLSGLGTLCYIAAAVIFYIMLYKFYNSVAPDKAVLFLVLSIIFSVAMPFIFFSQRNKLDDNSGQYVETQPYNQ